VTALDNDVPRAARRERWVRAWDLAARVAAAPRRIVTVKRERIGNPVDGRQENRPTRPYDPAMKNKSPIDSITTDTDDAPLPSAGEPQRVVVHLPVNVRNASMVIIAVLLSVFMLNWAKAVFILILLGLMASYALTPVVDRLYRWRIPRVFGAAVLLTAIVGALGWTPTDWATTPRR
jgi:hypothetical protein